MKHPAAGEDGGGGNRLRSFDLSKSVHGKAGHSNELWRLPATLTTPPAHPAPPGGRDLDVCPTPPSRHKRDIPSGMSQPN